MKFLRYICAVCFILPSVVCLNDVLYNLTEEQPPDTYLGNVAADADLFSEISNQDDRQNMKYSFLSNNFVQYFNINERQSFLYTSQNRIDREKICEFSLNCVLPLEVIAQSASGEIYKKIQVTVNILDANDHTPTFDVKSIQRDISEGSLIGYTIPIDSATDKDKGVFSIQNYTLDPIDSPFSVHFGQREDGSSRVQLVLNKKLDREKQNQYHLRVTAADGDDPPKTGTLEVDLSVSDINDNAPAFSKKIYNVTVTEDVAPNTTIVTVSASDHDQGDNGRVSYQLSQNQDSKINTLFAIDEVTGSLYVVGSLIYEPGESYKIFVVASDNADPPLRSQAQVYVKVLDVHNNPPQINVNLLSNTDVGEISENASINAAVAHIKVFDPDTGANGIVNCTVQSSKFSLQRFDVREYKVVLSKPLNRESVDRYDVTVLCYDSGTPKLNSSAAFTVHVMDVNDNKPKFTQTTYIVSVAENTAPGTSVYRVTASDFDSGKNSEIVYFLTSSSMEKFNIDPVNGLITVAGSLDRETRTQYTFVVYAKDKGSPALTGSAEVRILVKDLNDNSPVFINTVFEYNLIEGNSVNTSVGVLKARDKDEGKNGAIKYFLHPNYNIGIPFTVLENGTILASQVIDREVKGRYDFTVIAEDDGSPSLRNSAHVTVFVLDINDNVPQFVFPNNKNNTIVISFQTKQNTIIGTVDARDLDDGLNSKVTYFMKDKNFSNIFQLNSLSGRLVLIKELNINDAGKYTFGIIAQDKGTPPRTNDITMSVVITTQTIGLGPGGTEENRHYFLIAVAISCVTVVIAVVIILTICLIKRADRIKQKYHENKDCDQDHGESRIDSRKKVSFSVDERDMVSMPNRNNDSRLYPSLPIPASIQVPLKGSPEKCESDSGKGSLDSEDRRNHQIRSLQLHQALLRGSNDVTRRPTSHMSPGMGGILRRQQEADNHSDLSGEATTSDSGRGGSEDDLNTSCVLSSFSGDFDHVKHSPRGKLQATSKSNPRCYNKQEDLFPLPEYDYVQKDFGKPPCLPTLSFADKFFNFESTQEGLSVIKNGGMSPNGSSCMYGGNDDSTTTSGSYVLEDEDEYVEALRPSRQCIV